MSAAAISIRESGGAVLLKVAARPGSGRDRVLGVHGDALKLGVSAPPEKGKANEALVELLARVLGVRRTAVALQSGDTAKIKVFRIEGVTAANVRSALEDTLRPDA